MGGGGREDLEADVGSGAGAEETMGEVLTCCDDDMPSSGEGSVARAVINYSDHNNHDCNGTRSVLSFAAHADGGVHS